MARTINLTGSNAVATISGRLVGFYVNSTSSGTIIFKHNPGTDAGTALNGTITPAVGYHPFPADFSTGLYAKIGGTLNVTIFIE